MTQDAQWVEALVRAQMLRERVEARIRKEEAEEYEEVEGDGATIYRKKEDNRHLDALSRSATSAPRGLIRN